jgi:hypothetical protein
MVDIDVTPQIRRGLETLFRDLKRHAVRTARRQAKSVIIEMASNPNSSMPPLAGDVAGPLAANVVVAIQGIPVSTTDPLTGQTLVFDGSRYVPAASGDLHYTHTQSSASTTWSVGHNLGKFPSVSVVSGGNLVVANVAHTDANNLVITFSAATSGVAYMN